MISPLMAPPAPLTRADFRNRLLGIVGTSGLLLMPRPSDTTTSVGDETTIGGGKVVTWDATVAARLGTLGRGTSLSFVSASTQYGATPDAADMSFGNGTVDQAVSFVVLANVTDTAGARRFFGKYATSNTEYSFSINPTDQLVVTLSDESVVGFCTRTSDAAITMGSFRLFGASYTGVGGASAGNGVTLYQDGAVIASTAGAAGGTYVAMEQLAAPVEIGAILAHTNGLFDGSMALIVVCAGTLTAAQHANIAALCRRFYGVPA